jgi:hypothetical protein
MGRLRILSALTVGLLLGLVMITVMGGVAFGAIVPPRWEAEDMSESSSSISLQSDPDGSGPAGPNLRWASGATVSARASTGPTQSINVPTGTTVNQIQLFTRQASANTAVFAIYVDGTAAANRVGTFRPQAGSTWSIRTVNLTTAIQPGTHTLYIGPNATFSNNAFVDWFELHNTAPPTSGDTTPPLAPTIATGPAAGSTDTDGNVSFTWTGAEAGGTFQCSNVISGQVDNFTPCPSPPSPMTYDRLPNGSYIFKVRQIDAAGNVGAAGSRNYSVSTTLPPPSPSGFNPGVGKPGVCHATLSAGGNVETFLNSLSAGERGCLRGGLYTADNSISVNVSGTSASPIILAAYPGERAEIRASFRANSSSYIELEGLYVDGSYAPVTFENNRINTEQTVNLMSSNSWLLDSVELVNRRTPDNRDNAGTCVFGGTSRNAHFTHSWVHRCGELPRTNREHGIYVANSTGMLIEHSWFSDIADRAISYHSNVVGATSRGVVVDSRNGAPAFLIGGAQNTTTENSVAYVTHSESVNVGGAGGGSGNIFRNNCWNKPADAAAGVSYSNILMATPTFGSYPPNFKVTGPSSCVAMLPADSPFRP